MQRARTRPARNPPRNEIDTDCDLILSHGFCVFSLSSRRVLYLCLFYLAVIGSALTFLLLYWLMPRITVANLQATSLVTPPGAVALGWAIGGEKFSLWSLVGVAFNLSHRAF